jgi:hypothetical protein
MTAGAQTIAGAKTFSDQLTVNASMNVAGPVTLGPSGSTVAFHTVNQGAKITMQSASGHIQLERTGTSTGSVYLGTGNGDFRVGTSAGGTQIGRATAAGAWELGPSGGGVDHRINGFEVLGAKQVGPPAAGTYNNYDFGDSSYLYVVVTSGVIFTGFKTSSDGTILHIVSAGTFQLNHNAPGSTSRILTNANANITVRGATLLYNNNTNRWIQIG